MRGVNKVILIGCLGSDPDARKTQDGNLAVNFSLATGDTWLDKKTGERRNHVEWHKIVMYGQLAEIASKYLKKGTKAYVEGHLRNSKWQDKVTGENKYRTEIIGLVLQILEWKDFDEIDKENNGESNQDELIDEDGPQPGNTINSVKTNKLKSQNDFDDIPF